MTNVKQPTSGGRLSVFRNRNFTLLFGGSIISNAGSWMQLVAQGWLVYQLSDSPFLLGVVGVTRALPMILIAPFGGVVADRIDRVRLLKITQFTSMLLAFVPAVLVTLGMIEIWHLMLLSVVGSAAGHQRPECHSSLRSGHARRRLARDHPQRGLSVLLLHALLDAPVAHPASPLIKKS